MADIEVTKINEVFLRVLCQDDIANEISDFFKFKTPGHEWHPAFKKKKWDGNTYLFTIGRRVLYAGLLRYLITFAQTHNYTIELGSDVGLMNSFSLVEAKAFIDSLDIWSKGSALAPRDYQIVGVAKAIRYKRMLVLSPTSSGKSYMMYCLTRYLLQQDKRILIIVPTVNLVEQLRTDFIDYAHGTWDVNEHVHKIYQGQEKNTDKPVIISTWQSVFDEDPEYFTQFDVIIGDEAHLHKANSLRKILHATINAEYRIAMTGTLDDWEVHRLIIEGLFGPSSKLTTTKRMIDEKQSADIQIKCIILKHPTHICAIASTWKAKAYQKELAYLIGSVERNTFIKNLSLSLNNNTLILVQFIESHGDQLYKMIKDSTGRKVFYVHGKIDVDEREEVRHIVEEESDSIIVASYGVFSTGINIRNLHNIIFASPSKSKIRVLQSIGRGLRLCENKTSMTLFDITDDLRCEDYINYTLKHFVERVKIYKSEEFKLSNYNIELRTNDEKES